MNGTHMQHCNDDMHSFDRAIKIYDALPTTIFHTGSACIGELFARTHRFPNCCCLLVVDSVLLHCLRLWIVHAHVHICHPGKSRSSLGDDSTSEGVWFSQLRHAYNSRQPQAHANVLCWLAPMLDDEEAHKAAQKKALEEESLCELDVLYWVRLWFVLPRDESLLLDGIVRAVWRCHCRGSGWEWARI